MLFFREIKSINIDFQKDGGGAQGCVREGAGGWRAVGRDRQDGGLEGRQGRQGRHSSQVTSPPSQGTHQKVSRIKERRG